MAKSELREELLLVTNNFDRNIDQVMRKIDRLNNKTKSFGGGFGNKGGGIANMLQDIGGKMGLDGGVMNLVGSVGKLGTAFGVAALAAEGFNKTINSSQELSDEFGAVQQSVTTVVDDFFQSLASGDFSPFINGIGNIIDSAREAYNAMDDLWNMVQSFNVKNARLNNDFNENLNEIRKKKNSKDPNDQKRVQELIAKNKGIIKQQAEGAATIYNQTIKGLQDQIAAGTGVKPRVSKSVIDRILENDINNLAEGRKRYAKEYGKYLNEVDKLNKKADADFRKGGMGRNGVNYQRELNQLQSQYGEAIAGNYLLQRKNDDQLKEANRAKLQAEAYRGVAIGNESKLLRYTKENTEATKKTTKELNKQKDVYTEHATLTQEIEGNIRYIQNQLKKLSPSSKKYKELTAELNEWKRLLDADAGSLRYQNSLVSELQDKLQRTDLTNKDEFREVTEELERQKEILDDMTAMSLQMGINLGSNDYRKIQQNVANLSKLRELYLNNGNTMQAHAASLQLKAEKAKLDIKEAEVDYGYGSKGELLVKVKARIDELDFQKLQEKGPEGLDASIAASKYIEKYFSKETINKINAKLRKYYDNDSFGVMSKDALERLSNQLSGQYQLGSKADIEDQISRIQKRLDTENLGIELRVKLYAKKGELENQLKKLTKPLPSNYNLGDQRNYREETLRNASIDAQEKASDVLDLYSRGIIDKKQTKEEIAKLNDMLQKVELPPIQVHIETNFEREVYKMRDSWGAFFNGFDGIDSMVTSFESLTTAMDDNANAWKLFMGGLQTTMSIINAFTTVMETVNTLQEIFGTTALEAAAKKTAATQAEAAATTEKAASDTASIGTSTAAAAAAKAQEGALLDLAAAEIFAAHAAIPFAGVGIADGFIAQMLGTMSATAASTKLLAAFANGGVVGGSAFAGDRLLARVNSGEMILNGSQQKNLFDLIDGGVSGGSVDGNVVFKIHGQDLYGTLKNYTSIKSKTTNVTKLR